VDAAAANQLATIDAAFGGAVEALRARVYWSIELNESATTADLATLPSTLAPLSLAAEARIGAVRTSARIRGEAFEAAPLRTAAAESQCAAGPRWAVEDR
jgi:hypothetical protein